jgi:hypothetical protein
LKFVLLTLGLPLLSEPFIAEQWKTSSFTPLVKYAPFTAHVLSVEMFFQIALGANLISAERASNREDVAYLSYLPLCMAFVSSDKLHRRIAPQFLRSDQSFVWGFDLKSDLERLVDRYKALPQDEQEKGIMKFAHTPPQDGECLVTQIWNHHSGLLRDQRDQKLKKLFETEPTQDQELNERPKRLKPLPTNEQELISQLKRFTDAAELPPEELDFDIGNPDVLSIQRRIHKRKGSFWQLPKNLKEQPD